MSSTISCCSRFSVVRAQLQQRAEDETRNSGLERGLDSNLSVQRDSSTLAHLNSVTPHLGESFFEFGSDFADTTRQRSAFDASQAEDVIHCVRTAREQ